MTQTNNPDDDLFLDLRFDSFDVYQRKNTLYGASYETHGVLGILVRMQDKLKRAWSILNTDLPDSETLKDTLLDLENYATLARICEHKNNLKGSP